MTKKLYYENSYLTDFEAEVLSCEPYKEGFTVVLNETAFYPEGGGQPADEGFINEAKVSHVFIKDEVIYHVVDKALEVGSKVEGKIDFARRFDFMQQHSGEHIVSGIINAKYGYNNVGFHLSSDYMTADVDGELTEDQIKEVIQSANEAVFRNVSVKATVFENEEVKDKTYRSKIELVGKVRLVEIGEYDTCACCGTHVKNAGEIGIIECINWERHRGGIEINDKCEVLDKNGKAISGLYAAGAETNGAYGNSYVYFEGGTLGYAYGTGRIAGQSAASKVTAE